MPPPLPERMPEPLSRRRRPARAPDGTGGALTSLEMVEFSIRVKTITPVLGGGAVARELDDDGLRAQSMRGHLRFWWRATLATYLTPTDLYAEESRLFGGVAGSAPVRSLVELRVERIAPRPGEDRRPVAGEGMGFEPDDKREYAIWPALQGERARWRLPGETFEIHLCVPKEDRSAIEDALRAWVLFGGIGSRTRRGVGAVTIDGDAATRAAWLPAAPSRAALIAAFGGRDVLAPITHRKLDDMASVHGAGLLLSVQGLQAPEDAWKTAITWLRDFRQGMGKRTRAPDAARERGSNWERPGRSNWPEPDKMRHHFNMYPPQHAPRHNAEPVWPRAAFGLPIQTRFQSKMRNRRAANEYFFPWEPRPTDLYWRDVRGKVHDRLASPLVVKPLALADGTFAAAALWFERGYPRDGRVGLSYPGSIRAGALFDVLVAARDVPKFAILADRRVADESPGRRMRRAFFLATLLRAPSPIVEVAR